MAGSALDWSNAQVVDDSTPTPSPTPALDWSKAQVIADSPTPTATATPAPTQQTTPAQSFLAKAAAGTTWLKNKLSNIAAQPDKPDDTFGNLFDPNQKNPDIASEIDHSKTLDAAEKWINHLGYVDIPDAEAPGGKRSVKAFDVPAATQTGLALGLTPLLGPEITAGATTGLDVAANTAELGTKLYLANKMSQRFNQTLKQDWPSQTRTARAVKWLADQGVQTVPFMLGGGAIDRLKLKGELLGNVDPGTPPPEGEEPWSEKTRLPEPTNLDLASKLTPPPEKEPEMIAKPPNWDDAEVIDEEAKPPLEPEVVQRMPGEISAEQAAARVLANEPAPPETLADLKASVHAEQIPYGLTPEQEAQLHEPIKPEDHTAIVNAGEAPNTFRTTIDINGEKHVIEGPTKPPKAEAPPPAEPAVAPAEREAVKPTSKNETTFKRAYLDGAKGIAPKSTDPAYVHGWEYGENHPKEGTTTPEQLAPHIWKNYQEVGPMMELGEPSAAAKFAAEAPPPVPKSKVIRKYGNSSGRRFAIVKFDDGTEVHVMTRGASDGQGPNDWGDEASYTDRTSVPEIRAKAIEKIKEQAAKGNDFQLGEHFRRYLPKKEKPAAEPETPQLQGDTTIAKLEDADQHPIPDPQVLTPQGQVLRALEDMPAGKVRNIPTSMVHTDPDRFQYKLNTDAEGGGRSLTQADKYNENLAGVVTGYYDSDQDKLFIVNGHQRYALAKRTGHPTIAMRVLDSANGLSWAAAHNVEPGYARSLGALQNIAERSVVSSEDDAVDAAQWLRDQKATPAELKAVGLDLSGKIVQQATALQHLNDNLFHWVKSGELGAKQGVVIGQELAGHERLQDQIFGWYRKRTNEGKTISTDVLRQVARQALDAPEYTGAGARGEQMGLGGDFDKIATRSLWEERGEIMAGVLNKLARERTAFSSAAKNQEALESAGNIIADTNKGLAKEAQDRLGFLDSNRRKDPAIQNFLNQSAHELALNPKQRNAIVDRAYDNIIAAADEARAALNAQGGPPDPTPSLFGAPTPEQPSATYKDPQTGETLTAEQAAKKTREPGFSLNVGIPGLPQLAQMMEPGVKLLKDTLAAGSKAINDKLRYTFAPQMLSKFNKRAGNLIVEKGGRQAMASIQAEHAIAPLRDIFNSIPQSNWRERFVRATPLQHGQHPDIIPDEYRPVVQKIIDAYEQRWRDMNDVRAQAGKGPVAHRDNYFSQMWADSPEKVRSAFAKMATQYGGKPLTRGTPFLHARHVLDYNTGMQMGLTPLFDNPADMWLHGLRQMDAYIFTQRMFNALNDAGFVRFFKPGQHEEGWSKVSDSFFNVVRPTPQGLVQQGEWRMPDEMVRLFDNHLKPSVATRDKGIGGVIVRQFGPGSGMAHFNAFRVGLSAFHFFNTMNSVMAQMEGTGIARMITGMAAGDMREMANGLKLIGKGVVPEDFGASRRITGGKGISGSHEWYTTGDKIIKAMAEPGTQGAEWDAAAEAAAVGGMRVKPEQLGTLTETLNRAMQEVIHPLREKTNEEKSPFFKSAVWKAIRAPFREAGALTDLSGTALMNHYIPRVKHGAYYHLLNQEMQLYVNRTGGTLPWVMQREIMQNAAAAVDSLFGQMVEDNLFMSKTMKDVLHMGIAYPGWNMGSLRMLLKATQGVGKWATFQDLDTQQRLAVQFAFGMLTSQAMEGAMVNRMLTGAWPTSVQDLYQPRDGGHDKDGNPTRVSLPSYMRTFISMGKGFNRARYEDTAWGKTGAVVGGATDWAANIMGPLWGAIDDIRANKDHWTGVQLVDPNAPLGEQSEQFGQYVFNKVVPFSLSNAERVGETSAGAAYPLRRKIAGYIGLATPVPQEWLRTPTENYIMKQASEKVPEGAVTERQHDLKQMQIALEEAHRSGKPLSSADVKTLKSLPPDIRAKLDMDARRNAYFPKSHVPRPRIQIYMQRLPLDQLARAYEIAQQTGDKKNMGYLSDVIKHKVGLTIHNTRSHEAFKILLEGMSPEHREHVLKILTGITHPTAAPAAPAGPEA